VFNDVRSRRQGLDICDASSTRTVQLGGPGKPSFITTAVVTALINKRDQQEAMFSGSGADDDDADPYAEVRTALVDAGYFRARISTLPPFDLLVGGLAWAITLINMEVDLSLDDQANLGQKIKLAEIICKVLGRMRCPHRLLAHQIQGLDFPRVLPVLQWLLLKVVEVRAENEAATRKYSEMVFDSDYVLPEDSERLSHKHEVDAYVLRVREQYKPRRKMKRSQESSDTSEDARVRGVMMEYGANINELMVQKLEEEAEDAERRSQRKTSSSPAKDDEWAKLEQADKLKLEGLQKLLAETRSGSEMAISSANVRAVVAMQQDAIRDVTSEFDDKAAELEQLRTSSQGAHKEAHRRAVAALQRKVVAAEAQCDGSQEAHSSTAEKLQAAQADLKKKQAYNAKARRETEKLNEKEAAADQVVLAALKRLVTLNEALKAHEAEFKASCRRQLEHLNGLSDAMGEGTMSPEEEAKVQKINDLHVAELKKWDKLRAAMAAKARQIMMLQRKIDEVPTRQELLQFERRFTELYDQVQNKQEETRRHYQTFNTLKEAIEYADKEIEILDSMYKQIAEQGVLSNSAYADAFKTSMQRTLDGVLKMLERKEAIFEESRANKEALDAKLLQQVEKQRKHFKAVKDLQVAFDLNAKIRKTGLV
jgi:hypothetical protein